MKTKQIILVIIGVFVSTWVLAQDEEVRQLDSFDRISVGESIKVTLVKGSKNEAVIKVSGADTDDVLTDVNGDYLKVHMAKGSYFNTNVEVRVTYSGELEEVKVSSSGKISSEGVINSEELFVKASSSGRMELAVNVDKLKVDVSSSGRVALNGKVNTQVIEASSSGRYDGFDVDSRGAKADVSSSGRVEISVSDELFAEASSSGKVVYKGQPEKVMVDTSSSGSIKKG